MLTKLKMLGNSDADLYHLIYTQAQNRLWVHTVWDQLWGQNTIRIEIQITLSLRRESL